MSYSQSLPCACTSVVSWATSRKLKRFYIQNLENLRWFIPGTYLERLSRPSGFQKKLTTIQDGTSYNDKVLLLCKHKTANSKFPSLSLEMNQHERTSHWHTGPGQSQPKNKLTGMFRGYLVRVATSSIDERRETYHSYHSWRGFMDSEPGDLSGNLKIGRLRLSEHAFDFMHQARINHQAVHSVLQFLTNKPNTNELIGTVLVLVTCQADKMNINTQRQKIGIQYKGLDATASDPLDVFENVTASMLLIKVTRALSFCWKAPNTCYFFLLTSIVRTPGSSLSTILMETLLCALVSWEMQKVYLRSVQANRLYLYNFPRLTRHPTKHGM